MSEALQIAIFNMVASIGIDATAAILRGMKNATTLDDAVKALEGSIKLTAKDFEEKTQ